MSETEKREDLVYDGVCPICGDPFTDGYAEVEAGNSYDAKICIVDKDGKEEGSMLVHLEGENNE